MAVLVKLIYSNYISAVLDRNSRGTGSILSPLIV